MSKKITLKTRFKWRGMACTFSPAFGCSENIANLCNDNQLSFITLKESPCSLKFLINGEDEAVKKVVSEIEKTYLKDFIVTTN